MSLGSWDIRIISADAGSSGRGIGWVRARNDKAASSRALQLVSHVVVDVVSSEHDAFRMERRCSLTCCRI